MAPLRRMDPRWTKTYSFAAPIRTHFYKTTCELALCSGYVNGFQVAVLETVKGDDLGDRQAYYIRKRSGKSFTEEKRADGYTVFSFPSGQRCFKEHEHFARRPDKAPVYYTRNGTGQQNLGNVLKFNHSDWLDSFANHQDRIVTAIERKGLGND